ncbi:hypothetical protein GGQ22_01905 [Nocardioides sp. zg-579]|uniref:Glycosyltransferase family 39 protein n=1 Tax=Nocardioides marmotae TaxID=2663857 RepID=A0A6I3J0S7_9ACTN|nr:hypothetical protein [Nocardioides marmotae]MCR6030194.1 hypothetical protein [Gordonia jinghuaiqii]MTB93826.1 hypothetical protein [Nocardioides marmotae]QKE00158.1 hypothetical protein HPC71_02975 [Nocardioides marmotae]
MSTPAPTAPPAATPAALPVVISNRERLAGVVQAVGRRPADVPRRPWESLLVLGVSTVAYTWFGYWLVVEMHVVGFETLDRLNRALMVWHNDPTKLSALGFDYPPLATLLLTPLTIFPGPARALVVVPLGSALFAGLTLMTLNTMLRRAQVAAPLRVAVLVALGCNPLVVLYAADGARHFIWLSFVVVALGALLAWYVTSDIRFVMIAGLAYSVAALAGYSSLLWFVLSLLMVAAVLARQGADGTEIEGTTVGFAAPTVYVIALWTAFNGLLLLDPFSWITESSDASTSGGLRSFSVVELATDTGRLVLLGAPLAVLVLPALVFAGVARRNTFALWLAVMLGAAVLMPALAVALRLTDSPLLMRNALPILLLAVVGAIWLARSAGDAATLVGAGLTLALLASIPWTFHAMRTYEYQNLESSFAAAVSTRESQEGARTLDGATVGIMSEEAMAGWIRDNVTRRSSILTDNAQTYAVMLLTGRPDLFFDRVDASDGPWLEAAKDPALHVDFLLLSTDTQADLLSRLYPDAAGGTDALLTVAYSTPRYTLVAVPSGFRRDAGSDAADEAADEAAAEADTTDPEVTP